MTDYQRAIDIIKNKRFDKHSKQFLFEFVYECDCQFMAYSINRRVTIDNYNRLVITKINQEGA